MKKETGDEEEASNTVDLSAVNELTPPEPFNPAAVEDDEKTATQTAPPIVDLAAVNELTPPIPFDVAAVEDDENIKAAAAAPPTTQTEPPIRPGNPSSTLYDEESNINPQEDDAEEEFVEHATSSRMIPSSFQLIRSVLRMRGSDQSPSGVERNSDSAIHVPVA